MARVQVPLTPAEELELHRIYVEHALNTGLIDEKPVADSHTASFGIVADQAAASFALAATAPKPVDPMIALIAPFVGNWAYNFSGTGQSPANGAPAPKISVAGIINIDAQGAVTTFDTAHPGENRPGQSHPAWLNFRDFMVTVDPDTGAQTATLLAHWHAGTGQMDTTAGPSPIGPWADIMLRGDTTKMTADFTNPSQMYLTGTLERQ